MEVFNSKALKLNLNVLSVYFVAIYIFNFIYKSIFSSDFISALYNLQHPLFSISFIFLPNLLQRTNNELKFIYTTAVCLILSTIHYKLYSYYINDSYVWTNKVYFNAITKYLICIFISFLLYKYSKILMFKIITVFFIISLLYFCNDFIECQLLFKKITLNLHCLNQLTTIICSIVLCNYIKLLKI